MASIRIRAFSGLMPAVEPSLLPNGNATIAHNCLLWDGSLRPMAQWVPIQSVTLEQDDVKSIAYDRPSDLPVMYYSFDATYVDEQPFATRTVLGAGPNSIVARYQAGDGTNPRTVAVYPTGIGGSVEYVRAYLSNKPVNRLYGATRVRKIDGKAEEGTLTVLPGQDPNALIYEGDTAQIQVTLSALDDGVTHVRLYRTISGLDTGESVTNEPDTHWHLIAEIPVGGEGPSGYVVEYIDGGSATTDPLDVYYADEFFPPVIQARYFGMTEGGWFVAAGTDGEVQISERYLHHAWPTSNRLRIPYYVTSMAVSGDNIYLGTEAKPYVISVSFGDKAMQALARPYEEFYPCRPNTMWATPSGAMYCSNNGVVALGRDGLQVITSGLLNPGDVMLRYTLPESEGEGQVRVDNATFAVYDNGWYYVFCDGPPRVDYFYLTSNLYPVEAGSSDNEAGDGNHIQSQAFFVDARNILNSNTMVPEAIDVSCEFVSAELRTPLVAITMDPEAIDVSCEFVSATLRTQPATTMDPEAINVTCEFVSATLESNLVTNVMAPEAINVSCEFVGATLE